MDFSHVSQLLADIPVSSITVFAVVLTIVRLGLVRLTSPAARAFAEVVEAALIAVVLVFMIVQPFVMKSFYIPSGSMLPTLVDDDHIVVNKLGYLIHAPQPGDVVVFVAPPEALSQAPEGAPKDNEPVNYIKRMIGASGDVIEARHGYVTVNGVEESHEDIRRQFNLMDRDRQHVKIEPTSLRVYDGKWITFGASDVARQFSQPGAAVTFHPGVTIRNGKVIDGSFTAEDPEYDLKLYDGQSLLRDPDSGGLRLDGAELNAPQALAALSARPGAVPAGRVFVMGDNRNDSNDSTRWGPLEENRIVGKADVIFWPLSRMRGIR